MRDNAVSRLRQYRLSISTRPFKARGFRVIRCSFCLLPEKLCLCETIVAQTARSRFCLMMYDTEVMKPSNTGKLIADVLPDTQAFLWSRTNPEKALLDAINDPLRQAYVVFPESYAPSDRMVYNQVPENSKPPLFIMLDGTWQKHEKCFAKALTLIHYRYFLLMKQQKVSMFFAKRQEKINTVPLKLPPLF